MAQAAVVERAVKAGVRDGREEIAGRRRIVDFVMPDRKSPAIANDDPDLRERLPRAAMKMGRPLVDEWHGRRAARKPR
jgi:hypothetical protein